MQEIYKQMHTMVKSSILLRSISIACEQKCVNFKLNKTAFLRFRAFSYHGNIYEMHVSFHKIYNYFCSFASSCGLKWIETNRKRKTYSQRNKSQILNCKFVILLVKFLQMQIVSLKNMKFSQFLFLFSLELKNTKLT